MTSRLATQFPQLVSEPSTLSSSTVGQSWLDPDEARQSIAAWSDAQGFAPSHHIDTSQGTEDTSRYQLVSLIGQGGMGKVWLGWDSQLARHVAIKEPLGDASSAQAQHLNYEAMMTARLEHPSIVSIHDIYHLEGRPHFVMKLLCGEPLAHHIKPELALSPKLVRHVLTACEAIGYAHRHGIIHRDISPMNVLVDEDGATHLIDWGLAISLEDLDAHQARVGTPGYIAPEQREGHTHHTRSDVWSLGALLHHVVHGAPIDTPSRSASHPELQAIIDCATHHDPAQRYPSGSDMASDLERWFEGRRVHAYHQTPWRMASHIVQTYRAPILITTLVLLAISTSILWGLHTSRTEAARARHAEQLAISRKQEAEYESARTREAIAQLIQQDAMREAERHNLFGAEDLARQGLRTHDTPQARGLLAWLSAQFKPTFRHIDVLPECQGSWLLTDVPDIAICFGHITQTTLVQVTAWSTREHKQLWMWGEDLLRRPGCGVKHIASLGEQLLLDSATHPVCLDDLLTLDVHTGDLLHISPERGQLISTHHDIRLSDPPTSVVGHPATRNVCADEILNAAHAPNGTLWFVCDTYDLWSLSPGGQPSRHIVSRNDQLAHIIFDTQGNPWGVSQQGALFSLDVSHVSWDFGEPLEHMFMLPDTTLLVMQGKRGSVRLFDVVRRAWHFTMPDRYLTAHGDPGGELRTVDTARRVQTWSFGTSAPMGTYRTPAGLSSLDWSSDARYITALDGNGNVHTFSHSEGRAWPLRSWLPAPGKWVAATRRAPGFLLAGMYAYSVHELRPSGVGTFTFGKQDDVFSKQFAIRRLMLSPDDDQIVLHYGMYGVHMRRAHEDHYTTQDFNERSTVFDADTSNLGTHVLLIAHDNVARWDWRTDDAHIVHRHPHDIKTGSINERGDIVMATRQELLIFAPDGSHTRKELPGSKILDVEWVPGRPWVAIGKLDGTLSIWDVETQSERINLRLHKDRISTIAASPDGLQLATASWDGTVRVWDMEAK